MQLASGFTTPSGNISCRARGVDGPLSCRVGTFSYPPPTRQSGCADHVPTEWKWGQLVSLEDGLSGAACTGSVPVAAKGAVLQYGSTVVDERYSCRSEKDGVTCVDLLKRRGFQLSQSRFTALDPAAVGKAGFPKSALAVQLGRLDVVGSDTVTFQPATAMIQPNQGYRASPDRKKLPLDDAATFTSMGLLCQTTGGLNPWTSCRAAQARGVVAAEQHQPIVELITRDGVVVAVRQQWEA